MTPSFFTDDVKASIIEAAEAKATEEICGLIVTGNEVLESENVIEGSGLTMDGVEMDRTTGYLIDQDLIDENDGNILCVFHSHWDEMTDGYLSFTDIEQSRFHQIPHLLYHTEFKTWDYFDPLYHHPFPLKEPGTNPQKIDYYLNWPFDYGRADCASLLRAYFHNVLQHEIPDYPRPAFGDWYAHPEHQDAYLKLMQDPVNGFVQVNTSHPKKHDVVLCRWFGSRFPAHAGIMTSDNTVLHILRPGHLSEVVVWGGAWERSLHSVWRLAR
jgi:proteasome lid subunit RPN8/RPN11